MPDRLKLPGVLSDVDLAHRANRSVCDGSVQLDWSETEAATDHALAALVQGLSLDSLPDEFGAETMRDAVSKRVVAAFEEAALATGPKKRKRAKSARPSGQPAVWHASSQPVAASEGPAAPVEVPKPAKVPPASLLRAPSPEALRDMMQDALAKELLGPAGGEDEEVTDSHVYERYLVGMLAPRRLRIEPEEQDNLDAADDARSDDGTVDPANLAVPTMFPASPTFRFYSTARKTLGKRAALQRRV